MTHVLDKVMHKVEDELEDICNKKELTVIDVKLMYQMIDIVKDITTIKAMEKSEPVEWSKDYSKGYGEEYSNMMNTHHTDTSSR